MYRQQKNSGNILSITIVEAMSMIISRKTSYDAKCLSLIGWNKIDHSNKMRENIINKDCESYRDLSTNAKPVMIPIDAKNNYNDNKTSDNPDVEEIIRSFEYMCEMLKTNHRAYPFHVLVKFQTILKSLTKGKYLNRNSSAKVISQSINQYNTTTFKEANDAVFMKQKLNQMKMCSKNELEKIKDEINNFNKNQSVKDVIGIKYEDKIESLRKEKRVNMITIAELKGKLEELKDMCARNIDSITKENSKLKENIKELEIKLEKSEKEKDLLSDEYIEIMENQNLAQEQLSIKINKLKQKLAKVTKNPYQSENDEDKLLEENENLKNRINELENALAHNKTINS